jgi:hypothetical protein
VGKRVMDLAVWHFSDYLLSLYCGDKTSGFGHASGNVFADFAKYGYTVAELEAARRWVLYRSRQGLPNALALAVVPPWNTRQTIKRVPGATSSSMAGASAVIFFYSWPNQVAHNSVRSVRNWHLAHPKLDFDASRTLRTELGATWLWQEYFF